MHRAVKTLVATGLFLGLMATSAMAASPHFINASAARDGNDPVVSWKEAGLGDNQNIDYTATADFSRTDSCVNNGGNVPSDPKKTVTSGTVSVTGTFSSGRNGQITASLRLTAGPTTLECPPGQMATLMSLTWSNVSITDTTNGVTANIAGTF